MTWRRAHDGRALRNSGGRPPESPRAWGAYAAPHAPCAPHTPCGTGAELAPLGLAAAHLHAYRARAALPARARLHTGVRAAAGGLRPGRGPAVLRVARRARALAGPPRAVQRVRRALVRGDLPAAVHLAGRVR